VKECHRMKPATFRTRPSTWRLTVAPTGRAKCRVCKHLVTKGALRLEERAFVKVGRWTTFVYHTKCAKPVHAHAIARMYGSVERLPVGEGVGGVGAEAVCTLFPGGSMK